MAYKANFILTDFVNSKRGGKPVVHACFVLLEDAVLSESHHSTEENKPPNPEPQGTVLEIKNLSPDEAAQFSRGGNYTIEVKPQ